MEGVFFSANYDNFFFNCGVETRGREAAFALDKCGYRGMAVVRLCLDEERRNGRLFGANLSIYDESILVLEFFLSFGLLFL